MSVTVNSALQRSAEYTVDTRGALSVSSLESGLTQNGKQHMRVQFLEAREPLGYSVNVTWRSKQPPSSELCRVRLQTALNGEEVKHDGLVRMNIGITSTVDYAMPMTVASIGIPPGLAAQPWQLKEMMDKRLIDFYEITNGSLVLYFTEMGPKEVKNLFLDLKAEIPGTYTGKPSCAYVYYTPEDKSWVKSSTIKIRE